jgi:uncharacterized protein YkwD
VGSKRFAAARAALLLGLGLGLGSVATAHAGVATTSGCRDTERNAVQAPRTSTAQALTCLVNRARSERGLRALRRSAPLTRAATAHSADMVAAGFFSHVGSDGADVRRRASRAGYLRRSHQNAIGETLGWGAGSYATPSELFAALMRSDDHRRAILDARFRDIGAGVATGAPGLSVGLPAATVTLVLGRR